MENYVYRAVNPRDDEDVRKHLNLVAGLRQFCNQKFDIDENYIKFARARMGAIEYVKKDLKSIPPLEENANEFVFVCELDGEFIGYSEAYSYHIVDGKCPNDDIGILHEIFVGENHRNGAVAYTLMQMAVEKLIEKGKNYAICNVQEFNPNRFLHFAMADNKFEKIEECTREDGTKTIDYSMLIDLHKLKNTSLFQLAKKAVLIKNNKIPQEIKNDLSK